MRPSSRSGPSVCVAVFLTLWAPPATAHDEPASLDRARAFHLAGAWDEALDAYRAVARLSTNKTEVAIAHHNACLVLIRTAEHAAALDECRASLVLRRELEDRRGLARTLNNLGLVFRHLGRYEEAELAYLEALAINEERGDVEAQVQNRSNLGMLAMSRGRYGDAMRRHRAAAAQALEAVDEPWARRQARIARINQGVVLEKLGAYREALALFLELVASPGDDPGLEASLQANLGVIYRNLGDPVQAVGAFEKAADAFEHSGDRAALANAKLNIALALDLNLERPDQARPLYLEALELARAGGDLAEEIQVLFYLGRLELAAGRLDAAAEAFQSCLERGGTADDRWPGLYGLGRVAAARGQIEAAIEYLQEAMDEVEAIRSNLRDEEWRSGYFGDKRPLYAAAVRVLAELHRRQPDQGYDARAFAVVQRAKARELVAALGSVDGEAEPLEADAIADLMGAGEVLLEFFQGEESLFAFTITSAGVSMAKLGRVRAIFQSVAQVHADLAAGRAPSARVLDELSRTLFPEATPLAQTTSLRVAPDGRLSYLPFEILPDPGAPDQVLLDRLAITYLPSASTLARLADRVGPSNGPRFVGFANPALPVEVAAPSAPANLLVARHELGTLPAAEREVATVAGLLGGEREIWSGSRASEVSFRRAAARGARVLHLATHTVVDEGLGQGSVILLAAGEGLDGLLYPEEIAELEYRADLTVLASCRSALGTLEGGGALGSLTGSFLAAGSPAVLATLWSIEDAESAVFMEQFYYQLSRGRSASEALRRAKLRMRSDPRWRRSELWSAYVLIGDGTVTVTAGVVPAWVFLLAVLVLLAAGLVVVRRR